MIGTELQRQLRADGHTVLTLVRRAPRSETEFAWSPDGAHVGNLKRVGAVWKFKAVGYDAAGQVEPGGGPYTAAHNTTLAAPDAAELNARLGVG